MNAADDKHVPLINVGSDEDDSRDHESTALPSKPSHQPIPKGVKVCGFVTLFTVAAIVGSTGHAAYEATFATIGEAEYVAAASLIAGLDHTIDICTDPWAFFCGQYEKSHYMSGSRIGDLSTAQWRKALKAYEADKTGQSAAFFEACIARDADDASACDDIYANAPTLRELWRAGATHSNIGVARMPSTNPTRAHERVVVMWALNDTSATSMYPAGVSDATDPCKLVKLFTLIMCPDWASRAVCAAPQFLVAGNVAELCAAWTAVQTDDNAIVNARKSAVDQCYRRAAQLSTSLGCFLRTAEYYPDTNLPYLAELQRTSGNQVDRIASWFEEARAAVVSVAAPLGATVRARLQNVKLHSGWTTQNLPTPPPQLFVAPCINTTCRFVKAVAMHDAWQTETLMRETMQVHPRWEMNSWSINAYYSPSTNEIYVPDSMSVLISALDSATVGTLFFILSHELGHAFDPSARIAMGDSEAARYATAEQCIRSDYVNANKTIGEDFADFIGIQATAKYVKEKMGAKQEIKVRERTYTPAQQTLAAFGGFWCASTDNDVAPGGGDDPHSLPRDRVVQAVFKTTSAFGFGNCPGHLETCRFAV